MVGNGGSCVLDVQTVLKIYKSSLFRLLRNRPKQDYSWFLRQLVSVAIISKIIFFSYLTSVISDSNFILFCLANAKSLSP